MDEKLFGTLPEAIRYSGLSRTSIYAALKRGDLTARKCGRRTLVSFSDLKSYLASLPAYQAEGTGTLEDITTGGCHGR